jgi:hypothetical protein
VNSLPVFFAVESRSIGQVIGMGWKVVIRNLPQPLVTCCEPFHVLIESDLSRLIVQRYKTDSASRSHKARSSAVMRDGLTKELPTGSVAVIGFLMESAA